LKCQTCLLSGGAPDSPVHHRQPLFMSGARSPSYFGAVDRCSAVAVGASDTVRCTPDSPVPLPTVDTGHASPADCAATVALVAVGSLDSPVHHRIVR
jgi:hypothetical protein